MQKGEIIIKIRKGNNITKTKYNKKTSLLIIGKFLGTGNFYVEKN